MSDKTDPKDLEKVLARLSQEWQALADLLTSQAKARDRVIEAEKILLRDGAGRGRGNISTHPDGSADLLLGDPAGNAWVRLGVNRDGEAFLELKDQRGENSFKVAVGAPYPGGAEAPAGEPGPAGSQPLGSPGVYPHPGTPPGPEGETLDESGLPPALASPHQDEPPGGGADAAVLGRLEKLARQHRLLKWFSALILGLLGVILAAQAYILLGPCSPGPAVQPLVVRGPGENIRASLGQTGGNVGLELWDAQGRRRATLGLGADGAPGLVLYDQDQKIRAELNLGADGAPKIALRDQHGKEIFKEPKSPGDAARQQSPPGTGPGSEAAAGPPPPAAPAEATAPPPKAEPEAEFVGSKTSNKYHYPTCKWVKMIVPWKIIKFKSAQEAKEHHYIPCPVCKPPPLSGEPPSTP